MEKKKISLLMSICSFGLGMASASSTVNKTDGVHRIASAADSRQVRKTIVRRLRATSIYVGLIWLLASLVGSDGPQRICSARFSYQPQIYTKKVSHKA